jgi:hypothetical protein
MSLYWEYMTLVFGYKTIIKTLKNKIIIKIEEENLKNVSLLFLIYKNGL